VDGARAYVPESFWCVYVLFRQRLTLFDNLYTPLDESIYKTNRYILGRMWEQAVLPLLPARHNIAVQGLMLRGPFPSQTYRSLVYIESLVLSCPYHDIAVVCTCLDYF
jgi:hypothetical protein